MTISKTTTANEDQTCEEVSGDSSEKPNLKGDWGNLLLLTLLYTMQGIPFGFSISLPLILQSKRSVTYNDQGSLSLILLPYSLKLLWAPLVDVIHSKRLGRRKSWLLPGQYLIGAIFIYFANNVDDWLPDYEAPNLTMIACVMFAINFVTATQDICVDGWALSMLKKKNVAYASMCSSTGHNIGMFIGSAPIVLSSESITFYYLGIEPGTGELISIKSFLLFWGVSCILVTILVGTLKKEKVIEGNNLEINVFQNYKLMWDISKLPGIRVLALALLTSEIGPSTSEIVASLKIIDAGLSMETVAILKSAMFGLQIIISIVVAKYATGPQSFGLLMKLVPVRLLWCLIYALLIYYTPILIKNNGIFNIPVYYYFILGSVMAVKEVLTYVVMITWVAFFTRISDPRFGGTYMTFLNTIENFGWVISNTVNLKLVDVLTFSKCSMDVQNSCSTSNMKQTCNAIGGTCEKIVDGYYVEVVVCFVIGFIWIGIYRNVLKDLQTKNRSYWMINLDHLTTRYL